MFKEKVVLSGKLFVLDDLSASMPGPYPYHQHPEFELMYIKNTPGKWFVGDHIDAISPIQLVLLGPNLPHKWHFDRLTKSSKIVVLKWADISKNDLFKKYGGGAVNDLWQNAEQGVFFQNEDQIASISQHLDLLQGNTDLEAISHFIQLLNSLAQADHKVICSPGVKALYTQKEVSRFDKVLHYLQENYTDNLALNEVAGRFNLSRSGFCSFFKKRTGKTFSGYINELRIGNAKRSLIETDMPVNEVAMESGFSNISYFNRKFFEIAKISPRTYRKKYQITALAE